MNKKFFALPIIMVALLVTAGCHKKEVPPPPPPPPPVVEKKAEPVKVDNSAQLAKEKAERIAAAKKEVQSKTISFGYDKSELSADARSVLSVIAGILKENSEVSIRIEGHCDERGTGAYNVALGERRANAARLYLIDSGVSGSRIDTKSWGEERPVDSGHNEAAYSKNRRDEFVVP